MKILTPFGKWVPGQMPDVTRKYAIELIERKIAVLADDQTRLDMPPKKAEEKEQPIVVNNYFMQPGPDDTGEDEGPDDTGEANPKQKKKFFNK